MYAFLFSFLKEIQKQDVRELKKGIFLEGFLWKRGDPSQNSAHPKWENVCEVITMKIYFSCLNDLFELSNVVYWAINSVGRVPPLQGGSRKFESCIAHIAWPSSCHHEFAKQDRKQATKCCLATEGSAFGANYRIREMYWDLPNGSLICLALQM